MKISIIVPAKNEALNIRFLAEEIKAFMSKKIRSWELIFVDDASNDASWEAMWKESKKDSRIKVVSLPRSFGKARALRAGFDLSDGEYLLTMDADGEHDIRELPKFLGIMPLNDMVVGIRDRRKSPISKKIASRLFRAVCFFVFGSKLKDPSSPFLLFKREIKDKIILDRGFHRFFPIMTSRCGYKVAETKIRHRPRRFGQSKYPPLSRIVETLRDIFFVLKNYPKK